MSKLIASLLLSSMLLIPVKADQPKPLNFKYAAIDGTSVDLANMRGKVVLIDFWATWSAPSRADVPIMVAAYKKYHKLGFEILGVSLDQDTSMLNTYTDEYNMSWPEYFDGKGYDNDVYKTMEIKSIPTMWLVGKDGRVLSIDARKNLPGQIEKALKIPYTEK